MRKSSPTNINDSVKRQWLCEVHARKAPPRFEFGSCSCNCFLSKNQREGLNVLALPL